MAQIKKEKKYCRKCPNCDNNICYKDKWNFNSANKLNTKCLKCVRKSRGSIYIKPLDLNLIKKIKEIYYDLNLTLDNIAKKSGVSTFILTKIIKNEDLPMLKRNKIKWDRKESYKKTYKSRYGISHDECIKNRSDFEKYRNVVRKLTEKNVKLCGKFLGENKLKKRGKKKYHIDHIVSVFDGFKNNTPPFYLADISNLRLLDYRKNTSKSCRSDMELDLLIENILQTENNPILISSIWPKTFI